MGVDAVVMLYAAMLITRALLLTLLSIRCGYALYRNHLHHRVRVFMWATAAMALTASSEAWYRAYGRIMLIVYDTFPSEVFNTGLALFLLFLANIGLIVWIAVIEITTHFGILPAAVKKEG